MHKNHSWQWTFPTCMHLTCLTVSVIFWQFPSSTFIGYFCSLFPMYRTKFDIKMTKSKWNYTANLNMNVSGTVCQHIHYFPGKLYNELNYPQIISHSSYYMLQIKYLQYYKHVKISSQFLVQTFSPLMQKLMN